MGSPPASNLAPPVVRSTLLTELLSLSARYNAFKSAKALPSIKHSDYIIILRLVPSGVISLRSPRNYIVRKQKRVKGIEARGVWKLQITLEALGKGPISPSTHSWPLNWRMQWTIKAANLVFPALTSSCMSLIFLDFSIASHMPLLILWNTVIILKLT